MDHETAVQLQAAERYVLDEFSPKERADFEEHFFGCPGCADEVRSATILAANTKVVLKEAALDEENERRAAAERAGRRGRDRSGARRPGASTGRDRVQRWMQGGLTAAMALTCQPEQLRAEAINCLQARFSVPALSRPNRAAGAALGLATLPGTVGIIVPAFRHAGSVPNGVEHWAK